MSHHSTVLKAENVIAHATFLRPQKIVENRVDNQAVKIAEKHKICGECGEFLERLG